MKHHLFRKMLVRDKIPTWIRFEGRVPILRSLESKEYWDALVNKLTEEIKELKKSPGIDELVDVCEVLEGIRRHLNINESELQLACQRAREEKGIFTPNNFVEKVVDPP